MHTRNICIQQCYACNATCRNVMECNVMRCDVAWCNACMYARTCLSNYCVHVMYVVYVFVQCTHAKHVM